MTHATRATLAGAMHSLSWVTSNIRVETMKTCETCGNQYDKCFEIISDGKSSFFDSFECAIQALAPTCPIASAAS